VHRLSSILEYLQHYDKYKSPTLTVVLVKEPVALFLSENCLLLLHGTNIVLKNCGFIIGMMCYTGDSAHYFY